MSVKIYDSTIGAFKDAETPLIWEEQAQAWKDSVGLVWNESAQAWEERWGGKLWLYKEGDECVNVTGGWNNASSRNGGAVQTDNKIDLSSYSKMYVEYKRVRSDSYAYRGTIVLMADRYSYDSDSYDKSTFLLNASSQGYNGYVVEEIDISNVKKDGFIYASCRNSNSQTYTASKNQDNMELYSYQSGYCNARFYIKQIWME